MNGEKQPGANGGEELVSEYYDVSGWSANDCVFLGTRHDPATGFRAHRGECWILRNEPVSPDETAIWLERGQDTFVSDVWLSPAGVVWASGMELQRNPDLRAEDAGDRWEVVRLKPGLATSGVWGIDDSSVWAWGTEWEGPTHLFRFDGRSWTDLGSPGFRLTAVHALHPDLVCAGGDGGQVALWSAGQWNVFPTPATTRVTSTLVLGPDAFFATTAGGDLLEGSASGWGKVGEAPFLPTNQPGPLLAVASWKGALWLAAGPAGLLQRQGASNALVAVPGVADAWALDARRDLVVAEKRQISSTNDGKGFVHDAVDALARRRAGKALFDWSP